MKLNTAQVGEKLGVGSKTVLAMIRRGELTDIRPRREGVKRHYPLVDSKQVSELAKSYRNPKAHSNGNPKQLIEPVATTATGITSRLDRIEAQLAVLIRLWS